MNFPLWNQKHHFFCIWYSKINLKIWYLDTNAIFDRLLLSWNVIWNLYQFSRSWDLKHIFLFSWFLFLILKIHNRMYCFFYLKIIMLFFYYTHNFNWNFWYPKLRIKIFDFWNWFRVSVNIYLSITKSKSIINLVNW